MSVSLPMFDQHLLLLLTAAGEGAAHKPAAGAAEAA
jgi:hypothetical protein